MLRISYLLLFLFFITVSSFAKTTVYGKVTGSEGRPIRAAYVFLTLASDRTPVKKVEVQKNGNYAIDIASKGLWELHYSGTFHHEYKIPIYYRKSGRIKINVKLSDYDYESKFKHPKVFGNFNGWRKYRAINLKKNPDGTFSAVVKCNSDTVFYRLIDVRTGGDVAGTSADGYVPSGVDPNGIMGYNSFLLTKDGKAKIVFDPSKLDRDSKKFGFKFYPSDSFDSRFAEAYAALENTKILYESDLYKHLAKFDWSYKFDFAPYIKKVKNLLDKEKSGLVHQVLLLSYFDLSYLETHGNFVNVHIAQSLLKGIPFNSKVWSLDPHAIIRSVNLAAYPEQMKDKYLHQILKKNNAARTKEILLADVIDWKFHSLYYKAIPSYLSILLDKYGNSPEARKYRKEYARYIKIKKGELVPKFSVGSLSDPVRHFTNKNFKGKYCLLYFWSAANNPSVHAISELKKAHQEFKCNRLDILTVSLGSSQSRAENDMKKEDAHYLLMAMDKEGLNSGLCKSFEVYSLPKAVLINPEGKIAASGWALNGSRLFKTLKGILNN